MGGGVKGEAQEEYAAELMDRCVLQYGQYFFLLDA